MKSIFTNLSFSLRSLILSVLLISTLITLQSCIPSLGGTEEEEEERHFICAGINHDYDREVSKSDCLAVEREWIEGEGCYCGSGN